MNMPWSAEAEHRIRQRILLSWAGVWIALAIFLASMIGGLILTVYSMFILAAFSLFFVPWFLYCLGRHREDLGWEERILDGARFAGSGILANKPKDITRLTKWVRLDYEEMRKSQGWQCDSCLRVHQFKDFQWMPNILECDERFGDVPAVAEDPGGGRFVLVCHCGIGHYILKENNR